MENWVKKRDDFKYILCLDVSRWGRFQDLDLSAQYSAECRKYGKDVIIANRWSTTNEDVAALEDRGHMLVFDPPPLEIHRQAAIWFHDQEVLDFVFRHLHLVTNHSFRTYILASELKKAEMNWRQAILSRCLSGPALLVARIKADPTLQSEAARIKAFQDGGGGGRTTYFNHARKLSPPHVPSQDRRNGKVE